MVAGINFDLQSATVEWFERGETKGKEIDMSVILSLNPDIIILKPEEKLFKEPPVVNPTVNKLQKVSGLIL